MPLQPILVDAPFMQWGLDVIGPKNPKSNQIHSYILTIAEYFTKWKEPKSLKKEDTEELILFIEENMFSHFHIPKMFITDNGLIFIGSKFISFCGKYGITTGKSSNYYP